MSLNTFDRTQTQYERKMARQRQLDLMEAAASGQPVDPSGITTPASGGSSAVGPPSLQNSIHSSISGVAPPEAMENARRFLWDEDDGADAGGGYGGQSIGLVGSLESRASRGGVFARMGAMFGSGGGRSSAAETNAKANIAPRRNSMYGSDAQASNESEEYIGKDRESSGRGFLSAIGDCFLTFFHTIVGCCGVMSEQITACIGSTNPRVTMLLCCGTIGLSLFIFGIVAITHRLSGAGKTASITNELRYKEIRTYILDSSFTAKKHLDTEGTAQNLALRWLTDYDGAQLEVDDDSILQRYALAVFYFSTYLNAELKEEMGRDSPDSWNNMDYWMTEKGICLWYGVTCPPHLHEGAEEIRYNGNSDIIRLNLTDNNVKGTLPSEIVAFENLESLDLSLNSLSGTLPVSLTKLKFLKEVYLQENEMEGTIPTEIGNMKAMRDVFLGTNGFKGEIPTEFGRLTDLRAIGLDENFLAGSIPDEVYKLSNLVILYLDSNDLTGSISDKIQGMKEMVDLRLRKNFFVGSICPEINGMRKLELIYLDDNRFSGTIPEMEDLTRLQEIQFYKNALTGTIPTSISSMRDLKVLYLDNNELTGTLSPSLGKLGDLRTFYVFNNKMTGPIPTEFGSMEDLRDLQLYNNKFNGTIPSEFGRNYQLEKLEFQDNKITGSLPDELAQLEQLSMLKAYRNMMTGSVPRKVCKLTTDNKLSFIATDCNEEKGGTLSCTCCNACYP